LLAEASGEGVEGMLAVASVIKTRSKNRKISYSEVCLQPQQFSCWNGKSVSDLHKKWIDSQNVRIALMIAQNMNQIDTAILGNADHYHAVYCNPYWKDNTKKIIQIGNHIFYKLK
jgi:spore germination cell wall hydrolase CwlJ-like protein